MNFVAVIFALFFLAQCRSDQRIQSGDFGVKFEGNSAHIVFYQVSKDNEKGNNNFYKLMFFSLEEQNSSGKVPNGHKVPTLNGPTSQWSNTVEKDEYINANLTANFQIDNQDVKFLVATYLYSKETTAQNGNEEITIHSNSLKFTVRVQNWPFADAANTLHFYMKMVTNGKSSVSTTEEDDTVTSMEVEGEDDTTLYIEFPKTLVADGENKDVKVLVDAKGTTQLEFVFPSGKVLEYDPDVGIKATSHTVVIVLVVVGVVLVVAVAAIVGFIVYRKRYHGGEKLRLFG